MTEPATLVVLAFAATMAMALVSAAALRGWRDWLELRRLELNGARRAPARAAAGLELVDLRDRVRRLEAIANGIEA